MDPLVSLLTGFEFTTLLFKYLDYFLASVSRLRPPSAGALQLLVLFTKVNYRITDMGIILLSGLSQAGTALSLQEYIIFTCFTFAYHYECYE